MICKIKERFSAISGSRGPEAARIVSLSPSFCFNLVTPCLLAPESTIADNSSPGWWIGERARQGRNQMYQHKLNRKSVLYMVCQSQERTLRALSDHVSIF